VKPTPQQIDVFIDLLVDAVLREMREPRESLSREKESAGRGTTTSRPAHLSSNAGARHAEEYPARG
jgi:hypothetical protein